MPCRSAPRRPDMVNHSTGTSGERLATFEISSRLAQASACSSSGNLKIWGRSRPRSSDPDQPRRAEPERRSCPRTTRARRLRRRDSATGHRPARRKSPRRGVRTKPIVERQWRSPRVITIPRPRRGRSWTRSAPLVGRPCRPRRRLATCDLVEPRSTSRPPSCPRSPGNGKGAVSPQVREIDRVAGGVGHGRGLHDQGERLARDGSPACTRRCGAGAPAGDRRSAAASIPPAGPCG